MNRRFIALAVLCSLLTITAPKLYADEPLKEIQPKVYGAQKCASSPVVDGKLDESLWSEIPWTDLFIDIEGQLDEDGKELKHPRFDTRAAMCWDDSFFYIAAKMEEPHLWATYDKRDMVIFHENDFEVFIDPDGDTWHYYELEINALNTIWDLMLTRLYRYDGKAIDHFNMTGIQTAVQLDGTLNNPEDVDKGWTVEIAIPWDVLSETAELTIPPALNDMWRINFSRVQWHTDVVDGHYSKRVNPETGNALPEDNWVWTSQGKIAMHFPEYWGGVVFVDARQQSDQEIQAELQNHRTQLSRSAQAYQILRNALDAAVDTYEETGHYPQQNWYTPANAEVQPSLELTEYPGGCVVTYKPDGEAVVWTIREDGFVRHIPGE